MQTSLQIQRRSRSSGRLIALVVALVTPAAALRAPDGAGAAMTVSGPVDPAVLGATLMHEHVFVRPTTFVPPRVPAERALYLRPLSLEILSAVEMGAPNRDNLVLADEAVATRELADLKGRGGRTVVDLTGARAGRDPAALRRVAEAAGVNLVMGTGGYRAGIDGVVAANYADALTRDITAGVGTTGIRAGILGEIDLGSGSLRDDAIGVLRATAQASRRTGAAISLAGLVYVETLLQALDVLESAGADLARVIVGGLDPLAPETGEIERLLVRGVYVEFDMLGRYSHVRSPSSDRDVAAAVVALVGRGYARRILLSQNVRTKIQLKAYGGTGYAFVFEQLVPYLKELGLTEADIEAILVANPARVLTLAVPKA